MRIALLTLEATAASRAVRRFVASDPGRIALIGLSDPFRRETGGAVGQTLRRLRASGPGILPYLFVNFSLPRITGALQPSARDPLRGPLRRTGPDRAIPVMDVPDVNGPAFRDALAASGAELIVTFHFDQILKAETIAAASRGGINVHAGLLPQHRGPVPTIHALMDEPVAFGVSVHRLAPRIDAGELLAQTALPDRPDLTAIEAALLLHEAALPLLDGVLADIEAGAEHPRRLETLPYRGFPSARELRGLRAKGRRASGWRDVVTAWRYPA